MSPEAQRVSERLKRERERFNEMVTSGITNPLVAFAFRMVDRALFVPERYKYLAYMDEIVPLGDGVSLSQASLVARTLDKLGLDGKRKILEIGTGSGYVADLLSQCASKVVTVDYNPTLTEEARDRLREQDCINVEVVCGDGALGWPEEAPYDSIVVWAAAVDIPQALFDQLKDGGIIVLPVEKRIGKGQYFVVGVKDKDTLTVEIVEPVRFYPLVSDAHGGSNSDPSVRRNFHIIPSPTGDQTFERIFIQTPPVSDFDEWDIMWVEEESEQERTKRLLPELFGEN